MLIPSIDLMGGRVVQLEQGERLKIADDDVDGWIERFARFSIVQVIDLDAAKGVGENIALVQKICARLPCQVGGGVRTPARAQALVAAGARRVIVGSALYDERGVNPDAAATFRDALDIGAFVAAIDSRDGRVTVHGWRTTLDITPADAARQLQPYVDAFLWTNVDTEGLLGGLPLARLNELRQVATKPIIAAGGIRSVDEVAALDRMGVDAVVGMAIYTGLIEI